MKKNLISSSAGLMKNTIPSEKIIEQLNKVIMGIENSNSFEDMKEILDDFYESTKSWEIVTAMPSDDLVWMQSPMEYYEIAREFSLIDRIKLLFIEGILYKKVVKKRYAEIYSNTKIPMSVPLSPIHLFIAKEHKEYKMYYSAIQLARNIISMLKKSENDNIAVYEKPYGVVAMNNVDFYISDLEKETNVKTQKLRESLSVQSFHGLVEHSELQMIMDEETVREAIENANKNLPKKKRIRSV